MGRSSARWSVVSLNLGQLAFCRFQPGVGDVLAVVMRGGRSIRDGRCWERGNLFRTSRSGVIPFVGVQKVRSGLVPVFHLLESNEACCFGSNSKVRSLLGTSWSSNFHLRLNLCSPNWCGDNSLRIWLCSQKQLEVSKFQA